MIAHVAGRQVVVDPRLVVRMVRDEVAATPRPLRIWFGLLALLLLAGAVGAVRAIFPGDKGVNTTPTFEWGLLIVGYVFFAITTSGLCLASSLGTVFGIDRFRPLEKRHAILAVLCLVTAFGVIALDLHYPIRMVFGAALNPSFASPMWWMGVFYGTYLCFLLIEVWSIFWHHERVHAMACLLSSVMAVIAPSTLGAVFGVLAARPYWSGVFTPLLMVASALLAGTAVLGIVFYAVTRLRLTGFERAGALAIPAIRSVMLVAMAIVAALIARQLMAGLLASDPALGAATHALISGPLAVEFVGVRLVLGLAVPFLILVLPWTRGARGVLAAGCLSIVGVFADRLSFVSAGQIAPISTTSGVVSTPYAVYTPSLVEISILVGAVAFVAILYTLAERYLDLRETEVHIGFSLPLRIGQRLAGRPVTAFAIAGPVVMVETRAPEAPIETEREDVTLRELEPAAETELAASAEAALETVAFEPDDEPPVRVIEAAAPEPEDRSVSLLPEPPDLEPPAVVSPPAVEIPTDPSTPEPAP